MSSTDEINKLTSDFLTSLPTDSIDLLSLSDYSKHIVVYVAGTSPIRSYNVPTVMFVLNYSGVRVIASRILYEIFLLIGEPAIRRTSLYDELIFPN